MLVAGNLLLRGGSACQRNQIHGLAFQLERSTQAHARNVEESVDLFTHACVWQRRRCCARSLPGAPARSVQP
jgi:hypothetical protein